MGNKPWGGLGVGHGIAKLRCGTACKLAALEISKSTQLGPSLVPANTSLSSLHTGLGLAQRAGQPEQKGGQERWGGG